MRKVILLMHASLDGFVSGPSGEMNWIQHDDEIFSYGSEHFKNVDTSIYGRVTYEMMEGYWPIVHKDPNSTPLQLQHANWYDTVHKVVFSKTLQKIASKNTKVIDKITTEEILRLKNSSGKNIMIFGSPSVTHSLMQLATIDEYLINFNPVILGSGIPLFKNVREREKLMLLSSTTFKNGVIGTYYQKI